MLRKSQIRTPKEIYTKTYHSETSKNERQRKFLGSSREK